MYLSIQGNHSVICETWLVIESIFFSMTGSMSNTRPGSSGLGLVNLSDINMTTGSRSGTGQPGSTFGTITM